MSSEEEFDNDPENVSEPVHFLRVNYVLPISMNLRLFNHRESDQEESSDQEEMSLEENEDEESSYEEEQSSESDENNTMEIDESSNESQEERTSGNSNQERWIVISFYVPSSLFRNHDNFDDILDLIFRQTQPRGPPPTSKKVLDELKEEVFDSEIYEEDVKCVVCQENFQNEDKFIRIPCNHMYHSDCILPWLKQHNTCPTCRYELESEEEEKENEKSSSLTQEEEEQEEENEVY